MKQKSNALASWMAGVAACVALASPAHAVTVAADGSWNAFDVDPFSANSGGLEWIALDGSALSFEFDLSGPATLHIVDAGFAGDRFEIFDAGVSLGVSSAGLDSFPSSVGTDFGTAWSNAAYSRASFTLNAGVHSITGRLFASALDERGARIDATVGALSITPVIVPVPEPTTFLLMLAGLAGMALIGSRRR